MDISLSYSNPLPFRSDFWPANLPETSSASETASFSDEEVLLASSCPKKRAGRTKFRETRHPVFRGIRRRNSNKWVCEVREPNKKTRIWLGTFPTAEMAARAHDVAVMALRGRRGACLNFADSAWRLRVPVSGDAKDIQRAAAEAAEAFRPGKSNGEFYDEGKAGTAAAELTENVFYMDEEAIFGTPGFLANMAEGLMLPPPPPPPPTRGVEEEYGGGFDDVEIDADVSLWSHSI